MGTDGRTDASDDADAVVIGAGPNGLVAANVLADAGWSVRVLEAQPTPGGGVRSDRDVHPDFVHDTFSSFHPLAAVSPAMTALRLEQYGLRWSRPPAAFGHPLPGGRWALVHPSPDHTAALLDDLHRGDGAAWLRLCEEWDVLGDRLLDTLLGPYPPVRAGLNALARVPSAPGLVRDLLAPLTSVVRRRFGGEAPGLLLAGNAAHADVALTAPGSGLFGIMLAMLAQTVGFPVPAGGAGALTDALIGRLRERGGELVCDTEVTAIEVVDGRARRVRTRAGEVVRAGRAVIADVVAPRLYGDLLAAGSVPARVRFGMRRFRLDPATVKVDWALAGTVPWAAPPEYRPGTVHVADSVAELVAAGAALAAGQTPATPFLVAGQMTTADPSRSPAGSESMWAYTHVPQRARVDPIRLADRMQARLERLAPGFGDLVLARRVLTPADFEARDANLIGGAINGGSARLSQQLLFRPVPGPGGAHTGVPGLYLASASAHPGGGVHGAAGLTAARSALRHARRRPTSG